MLYCFLDTNVFLQYKMFDEVDWPQVLDAKEVCLVVPRRVIQEMDKAKNDPRSDRRRKRARKVLNKLEKYWSPHDAEIRKGTRLRLLVDNPDSDKLRERGYDPEVSDDEIVAVVQLFIEDNPEIDALLLAEDTGIRLKARACGLKTLAPPAEHRLPDEPDPFQKEVRELELQVAQLKARQPDLQLGFQWRGELQQAIEFPINFHDTRKGSEDIEADVSKKRAKLQYQPPRANSLSDSHQLLPMMSEERLSRLLGLEPPSEKDIADYEKRLEGYLQKHARYLESLSQFNWHAQRTRPLRFVLHSIGSVPAEDIDVMLYFPSGLELTDDILLAPKPPEPPAMPRPKSPFDSMLANARRWGAIPNTPPLAMSALRDVPRMSRSRSSGPTIRRTNSYEVTYSLDRLKQHFTWEGWAPLYATFDPRRLPTAIEVNYAIAAANIPQLRKGNLLIHLKNSINDI